MKRSLMHWQILMRVTGSKICLRLRGSNLRVIFLLCGLRWIDCRQSSIASVIRRLRRELLQRRRVQVDELCAKLRSFEADAQSGAIVASVPPPLSLSEERALIHDQ